MIFILNKQEKVVNILRNGGGANQAPPFFNDVYSQDLVTGAETFSFSTIAINNIARDLVVGNYVAFKNEDGEYKLFQITQTEEYHEDTMYMNVFAEGAGLELINKVFRARKAPSTSLRKFMEMVLDETGWNVGAIPFASQESLDLDLSDATVYSTLQNTLSKYGVEMSFRIEINHGRISSKFVDLYSQRGRVTGKRFSFGRDIEGIKRKVDSTELFTALIGRGNKDISFKDIIVEGVDKPLGQDFVTDQEAYDRYNNNGYHIVGIFKYDTDSPEELLRETYKQLQKCKEPKIQYDVSVALLGELLGNSWDKVRIGDTVAIVDNAFNPPMHLMARVSKLDRSFTNNQSDTCTLANFIEVQSNITDEMRRLASELEGYVDGALDSKFPIGGEDIKEGAVNGSHIYQNTISTDHLIADAVTADKIKANSIETKHLQADTIKSEHISAEQIEAGHIKSGTITADKITSDEFITDSAQIKDGIIGTAQIGDAQITVAKIQDLFVDNLVATQGKFQSAHIGKLTAENIDADTIKAEHITASVIDAINLNVEGKISADRIDVNSIKVENIDADKITTGTLDADRITSSVITAINASIENATIDSAKIGDLSADKITSGEISADLIKTNVITAINASLGKISADRIDVDSIKVGNIDAGQITTGDLSADRIQSTVISAINSYTGTAKIKQAQIETLLVGSANITDLDVSKLTGDKIDAGLIDADKLVVKSANVTGEFTADKISGGTLDASKMTVTNLRADSIVAGSITLEGNNLIHNSGFLNGVDSWEMDSNVELGNIDKTELLHGMNTIRINGFTNGGFSSKPIPATEGETFVGSIYIKTKSLSVEHGVRCFILFADEAGGHIDPVATSIEKTYPNNTIWERLVFSFKAPVGTKTVQLKFENNGAFDGWFAKPMLSRGSIASEWKLHNDELISNGAIDSDKIASEAVGADKLNVEELFVGDNAFIKKLKAVEIDASNITTGTISNDRIDIKGLVSFEAFDEDIQQIFDVTGNKTYINGGMIATNTIKANSIDLLSGLTVRGEDNTTTFAIASNGEVEVNGLLRSGNFDETKSLGYKISPDGTAILNQARVRGDVVLPNAGITNFGDTIGNENLAMGTIEGLEITGNGAESTNQSGILCRLDSSLVFDKKITISFEYEASKDATGTFGLQTASNHWHPASNVINVATNPSGKIVNSYTYTNVNDTTFSNLNYKLDNFVGTLKIFNVKVEYGDEATPWCPASKEQFDYTRIWAGEEYRLRDKAPFRVTQKGDLFANNATLSGRLVGAVDAGKVHIHNDEIVINSASSYLSDEGRVFTFVEERDFLPNPHLRLGAGTSLINTDLILGSDDDRKIEFLNENRILNLHKTALNLNSPTRTSGASVFYNPNGGYNSAFGVSSVVADTDSNLTMGYHNGTWANTAIVTHNGSRGGAYGDVCFKRVDDDENLNLYVQGDIKIRNSIQSSTQNIEMRSVYNEGWGFYAT